MTRKADRAASSPARIDHRTRAADAVRLRAGGLSYREIAAALGYASENAANKAVLSLLARAEAESADALRALENTRLDLLWQKAYRGIVASEKSEQGVSAPLIGAAVRISERRARLLGLDAPARVEVEQQGVDFDQAVREVLAAAAVSPPTGTITP